MREPLLPVMVLVVVEAEQCEEAVLSRVEEEQHLLMAMSVVHRL